MQIPQICKLLVLWWFRWCSEGGVGRFHSPSGPLNLLLICIVLGKKSPKKGWRTVSNESCINIHCKFTREYQYQNMPHFNKIDENPRTVKLCSTSIDQMNICIRAFRIAQAPFAFEFECNRLNSNSPTVCHQITIWQIDCNRPNGNSVTVCH